MKQGQQGQSASKGHAGKGQAGGDHGHGGGAITTTDHDEIRAWVEAHGGRPTHVEDTGGRKDLGILRFDFGEPDPKLEEISWEDFFEKFDEAGLALLYRPDGGPDDRFNKLVRRT